MNNKSILGVITLYYYHHYKRSNNHGNYMVEDSRVSTWVEGQVL